ncbi:MAG: hypothetical protein GXO07_06580 [Crenarchaeota archaeon]|nr:hypothetical protein [Thermoproteota archaeon]
MSLLKRVLRIYVYVRLGISNYLTFMIALFNTASLVWYFLNLKDFIPYSHFVLLFFLLYLPLAAVLGYYDLKKLVAKTAYEVRPYWKRPNLFWTRYGLGAIVYPVEAKELSELSGDGRVRECSSRAAREFLKFFLGEGRYVPKESCFCRIAYEEGLLDEEHYEMCLKVLRESE